MTIYDLLTKFDNLENESRITLVYCYIDNRFTLTKEEILRDNTLIEEKIKWFQLDYGSSESTNITIYVE